MEERGPADVVAAAIDRSTMASIILELRRWYASEEMHDAMRVLHATNNEVRMAGGIAEYYRGLVTGENTNLETAETINGARRRVAHYLLAWMKLCEHGLLTEDIAANLIAPDAIEFFLNVVDPLDQAHRRFRLGLAPNLELRTFVERLRTQAISPP